MNNSTYVKAMKEQTVKAKLENERRKELGLDEIPGIEVPAPNSKRKT